MQEARAVLDRLLQLKPNNQQLLKEYKDTSALATMQKGGWGSATSFRDVIRDTEEATAIEQDLKAVKTADDLASLIQQTKEKIEREPDNINYRRSLADLYSKNNQFEEAIGALEAAQAATGGGDPQIDRALSAIRIKRFDAEIARLKESGDQAGADAKVVEKDTFLLEDARLRVERYPNDREFKFEYGELLFNRGEFTEAVQQFQAARQNPKRRIQSLLYLARCFKEKRQYDIAREQLEEAAGELRTMDSTKKSVLYELGDLAERTGDRKAAVEYYKDIYAVDIGYRDVAKKIEEDYKGE
jgi:tetratricopeptide (TPR) repeat protein